jgi:hypothetical protein
VPILSKLLALLHKDIFVQKAIHDSDLERFLSTEGKLNEIENKDVKCEKCGSFLTKSSIGKICKEDEDLKLYCNDYICFVEGEEMETVNDSSDYMEIAKKSGDSKEIFISAIERSSETSKNRIESD